MSQVAILVIPAPVVNEALAPAFIVVVLDLLSGVPASIWVEKALPLILALVAAWPLGLAWGWIKAKRETSQVEQKSEADEEDASQTN
ncbi:hypothetical protein [Marinospirillum celere]|uniref:hypothetical protein n=1 Tax=Marinospirillum celere TaxID=1122252 RepID=UPI001160D743|nr:hypothetical protein [Marinospirillum celere]